MKRKLIPLLIIATLSAAPFSVTAVAQNTLSVDETKARAAESQAKSKEVVVKLRPGTKILVGPKAFPFEFIRGGNLSGRVKDVRGEDFTLSSTSRGTGEVTAIIRYTDVLSIKHPSAFANALKNIGKYSLLGPLAVAILPLYAVAALLGQLPRC